MKKLLLTLALGLSSVAVLAQGTVAFSNNYPTAVTNALTGQGVTGSNTFRAALYYAVDGVTDESSFVQLGATVSLGTPGVTAGMFSGGVRTTPASTPAGGYAMFQVRAWELAYGSNYQLAVHAPSMNGRRALVGKSNLMRIKTGGGTNGAPSQLFGSNANPALLPFLLDVAGEPQPEFSMNDVLTFEGDSGATSAVFTITVEYPNTNVVSVDFATSDGTALAGSDYVSTNGTVVFNPGETSKTIEVTVFSDTVSENDEWFWVALNSASNAVIRRGVGKGTIYNDDCRTSLSAALYTGVTFDGCVGKPYRIEASDFNVTNSWFALTNFVLPRSPFTWIDFAASPTQQRFYRAILLAP